MLAHRVGVLGEGLRENLYPYWLSLGLHVLQDPGAMGGKTSPAHRLRATSNIHGIECNKTLEEPR